MTIVDQILDDTRQENMYGCARPGADTDVADFFGPYLGHFADYPNTIQETEEPLLVVSMETAEDAETGELSLVANP